MIARSLAVVLALLALAAPAARAQTPATQPALKLEMTVDTTEVPELATWAAKVKTMCEEAYPSIVTQLAQEGFTPPNKVKLIFKDAKGIAWTAGTTITCTKAWFTAHPDDYGAVIHELAHVVQAYRKPVPGWVTEGIADHVRWFVWEPENRRPRLRNPDRAKYTDSYQTTAAFFDWIVRNKDKTFITRLNAAARAGKYSPDLFREYAGKPAEELWSDFVTAQKK